MTKKYSAIIIGSGFSGLCVAIELKKRGIHDFLLLEKAASLGGTWRENTYPGAECDIPSALYSYSFEPYPDWEHKWSHQPQILAYLNHCASKYDLRPHLRYNECLESATWQAEEGCWEIRTVAGTTYHSRTFIPAVGQLHHPSTPAFAGVAEVQIPSFHSARWRHDIPLDGLRVGVIGNAASALQFVPEIAPIAQQVTIFQRTPNWVLPKQDRLYREWEKALVRRFPFLLKLYRFKIWFLTGALFLMMKQVGAPLRAIYQWLSKRYLKRTISDPELRAKLRPNYPLGAKRVLFSDNYFAALNRDDVGVITTPIARLHPQAVQTTDGQAHELDVLIYATGFHAHPFLLGLDIRGEKGLRIREAWQEETVAYLGISVAGFPNLFMMYGPNTNLGHSSILLMAEAQAHYIATCVGKLLDNNWQSMAVKAAVQTSYQAEIQRRLRGMVWEQIPRSWYKTADGSNPNNWPGRTMEYRRRTRKVLVGDYVVRGF